MMSKRLIRNPTDADYRARIDAKLGAMLQTTATDESNLTVIENKNLTAATHLCFKYLFFYNNTLSIGRYVPAPLRTETVHIEITCLKCLNLKC